MNDDFEIETNDLFTGDPEYDSQVEECSELKAIEECMNFLGVKLLDSCQNCVYCDTGRCFVMEKFKSNLVFEVSVLQKCKHFKKRKDM